MISASEKNFACLNATKVQHIRQQVEKLSVGTVVFYGIGASRIFPENDVLVNADMARREIQLRMRRNEVNNLGVCNKDDDFAEKYKQGYFVDWRVCDRLKKELMSQWDFVLDTNTPKSPKLIEAKALLKGLEIAASRPFRVVPFFDPGP